MSRKKNVVPKAQLTQVHVDSYHKEITKKETQLIVKAIRRHAHLSDNGILRAMTSTDKPFQKSKTSLLGSGTLSTAEFKGLSRNLVHGNEGQTMLTRGALPTSIPAKYNEFPNESDWNEAEKRHAQLKLELEEVEREIDLKTKEVIRDRSLMENTGFGGDGLSLTSKPGSHIMGSAFKWKSTGTTNSEAYVWHKPKPNASTEQTTDMSDSARDPYNINFKGKRGQQYGIMTRCCDLPEGNILINKNAVKKVRGKTTQLS